MWLLGGVAGGCFEVLAMGVSMALLWTEKNDWDGDYLLMDMEF